LSATNHLPAPPCAGVFLAALLLGFCVPRLSAFLLRCPQTFFGTLACVLGFLFFEFSLPPFFSQLFEGLAPPSPSLRVGGCMRVCVCRLRSLLFAVLADSAPSSFRVVVVFLAFPVWFLLVTPP
jgi:hypothetical protein